MKNIKYKAFVAMGIVAVSILSSNMYQNAQAANIQTELKDIAICEQMVEKVSNRIASPLKKGDLNTSIGLQVADAQDAIQSQLIETNAQNVNCNIKNIRDKFVNKVNQINKPQHRLSSTTPG